MYTRQNIMFHYNLMNKGATVLLLSLFTLFASCTKGSISSEDNGLYETAEDMIAWNISSVDDFQENGLKTKGLVYEYKDLRNACSQSELYNNEKIGIFGSYVLDGKTESVFENTPLWWWEKENGNSFNDVLGNQSFWNYDGENKFWVNDADYIFRAYFPMSKITLQPGSGAARFLIVYDTQVSQYDMMVASRSIKSKEENPVQLLFRHTLAAVSFDFQFTSAGVSDKLTACWLENMNPDGFYSSSTLNYETSINWPQSTSVPVGDRIYYWEPNTPLDITSGSAAKVYNSYAVSADKGSLYTENDGWLLVIPQTTKGPESLKLCFTTAMGGNEVYRVGLPAATLEPGNRYTYHIKISSTSIDVNLSIKEWNERKSSYDIDFNNN